MALEITRQALEDAVDNSGVDLREEYAGRGMMGKTCIGVVGHTDELEEFERELAKAVTLEFYSDHHPTDYSDPEAVIDNFCSNAGKISNARRADSMGLSTIYYYPRLTITED